MQKSPPRCHGCGAAVGERHDAICDVARCCATGRQWSVCDHTRPSSGSHERDFWSGRWPGEEDCERLGFFARFVPGRGWEPCGQAEPGAQPDLNRLHMEAEWNPISQRWVLPVD